MWKITTYRLHDQWVIVETEDKIYRFAKEDIAEVFETFGWSFTKALWVALYRADIINSRKILTTWEDMAKEYIETFLFPKFDKYAKK